MKTKIFIALLAFGLFACGGETKSEKETPEVDELVEAAVDSTEATADSMAAEMDMAMTAASDSIEMAIDSVSSEAP